MKKYTIICVEVNSNNDSPITIQNYGLMDKEKAQLKLMEIFENEKCEIESLGQDYGIEAVNNFVGVYFDNYDEEELNRREYYLQELEIE